MGKLKLTYYKTSTKQHSKHATRTRNKIGDNTRPAVSCSMSSRESSKERCENKLLKESKDSASCSSIHKDSNSVSSENSHSKENSNEEIEFIIENQLQEDNGEIVEGRRIFDISDLIQQLKSFGTHQSPYECKSSNMVFVKKFRTGFHSELLFRCNMCGATEKLHSHLHSENSKNMSINEAVVFGNLCTGQSFAQMEERSAIMNMPGMSSKTYYNLQKHIHDRIKKKSIEEMAEAAETEKSEAISRGEQDSDGFPLLTVVVDGAWAKRSYKCNFSSLSGMACIVGFYTKKVIYMGVRNIFCIICARSKNAGAEVRDHICYKNWSSSANSMEADIIVEGFRNSVQMYGAKYMKVIGDGDSNVIGKQRTIRPYGINQPIEKIECTNHICRNFNNKLKELVIKKEFKLMSRNLLKKNLERFLKN